MSKALLIILCIAGAVTSACAVGILVSPPRAELSLAAGQTQKTFNVTTSAVVSTTLATITATRGPVTKTATLTINP